MMTYRYVIQDGPTEAGRGAPANARSFASRAGAPVEDRVLIVGRTLRTGEADFAEQFGAPTSLERDLLILSAAVFAADRATERGQREDIARRITLRVPVVNHERLAPLSDQLEETLRYLSQDAWTVQFVATAGTAGAEDEDAPEPGGPPRGAALLFSGGLDSLAGALEFAGLGGEPLELVSHRTHNTATSQTQTRLAAVLVERGFAVAHRQFFVSSRRGDADAADHDVENTQRTRSFLFLVLGALVARRTGRRELLYIAENGQMAVHLPLTAGRIGAFSTHTAHPDVLVGMERFLQRALGVPLAVRNPYVERTKREVVAVVHQHAPDLLPLANSCWRNAHLPAGTTHCGECVPCYVRRVAIEDVVGVGSDPTAYARDVWCQRFADLPENDDGRRNLADLSEFRHRFATQSTDELMSEFPELHSVNMNGHAVVAMYRRWATETARVWAAYPALATLL